MDDTKLTLICTLLSTLGVFLAVFLSLRLEERRGKHAKRKVR